MQVLDENTMVRLMGVDLVLYLKFLKNQAVMFLLLFAINFTILVPLYYSGADASKYTLVAYDPSSEERLLEDVVEPVLEDIAAPEEAAPGDVEPDTESLNLV